MNKIVPVSLPFLAALFCGTFGRVSADEPARARFPGPVAIRPCNFPMNFAFYSFADGVHNGPAKFKAKDKGGTIVMASLWDKSMGKEVAVYVSGEGQIEIWDLGAALSGGGELVLPFPSATGTVPATSKGPIAVPLTEVPRVSRQTALAWLKSDDWFVRAAGCWVLGDIGEQADFERLAGLLKDDHWYVRKYAIQAVARLGKDAAKASLVAVMKEEPSKAHAAYWREIVTETVRAMAIVKSADFVPVLEAAQEQQKDADLKKLIAETISGLKK